MTLTLVIGGARSGKSAYAETLLMRHSPPWRYVATAQAFDDGMRARIALHKARRDARWETVEAPLALHNALQTEAPILLDCLTLWLGNMMHAARAPHQEIEVLLACLAQRRAPTILVTTEVGQGIIPDNVLARQFIDEAGLLHQKIAQQADKLILMTAGYPIIVKPKPQAESGHDN